MNHNENKPAWKEDIEPEQFHQQLTIGQMKEAVIVDVRELEEWEYYHLDTCLHIPMNTIPARLRELPMDKPLYILCAHGVRSAAVCNYLRKNGYENVCNVSGGIAAVGALQGFQYD